jgi:phenylpropionate dioxygenase-like ring-hydroxylating dioxygenase large terminal subunit
MPGHDEALFDRLLARARAPGEWGGRQTSIALDDFTDPVRFERERETIFRRLPLLVAHEGELAKPGQFVRHDYSGIPLVVVRGERGPSAFVNVCRHRGSRLVGEATGTCSRAIVCPFHGWTYDLAGKLVHVPSQHGFADLEPSTRGLATRSLRVVHGLVFVTPGPGEPATDSFFTSMMSGLEPYRCEAFRAVFRRQERVVQAHWKVIVSAFLEGYHVRHLHKTTLFKWFVDNAIVHDRFEPHLRVLVARRAILDATEPSAAELRNYATYVFLAFPNTVVFHNLDHVSLLSVYPRTIDSSAIVHTMLIPEPPGDEKLAGHWDRNFTIAQEVFDKEDLPIAESIQAGLRSGANASFVLGGFEEAISWFHESVRART